VVPVLQALVLAEHVYEDKLGSKIIAGTFNSVIIRKRNAPQPIIDGEGNAVVDGEGNRAASITSGSSGAPWVYISLTDVCENTELVLQFVSLTKNKVLFGSRAGYSDELVSHARRAQAHS